MPASHACISLVAEITIQAIGGGLAALLASAGVFWVLFLLMVRGFWDKTGKPAVRALILEMEAEPERQKKRAEDTLAVTQTAHNTPEQIKKRTEDIHVAVQTWHNTPEQIKLRTDFIKGVIDNEVRRDDGLIYKEITTKVDAVEADLAKKIDTISAKFDNFQELNREFHTKVLAKLARIEGSVNIVTGGKLGGGTSADSFSSLPAQRPNKAKDPTSDD